MNGNNTDQDSNQNPDKTSSGVLACGECRAGLPDYLDGSLDKQLSLKVFLHLRKCQACAAEHGQLQGLFAMLDNLPDHQVPEGFDAPILAAVPYAAYRAMEPLRRERVPVYLAENFLPAFIRSRAVRWSGIGVSAAAAAMSLALPEESWLAAVALAGLVPELMVRLQGLGRRVVALRRVES